MNFATKSELLGDAPSGWIPEPVAILGKLESLIAQGVHIGAIEKMTRLPETTIHSLLDHPNRATLGMADSRALSRQQDRGELFRLNNALIELEQRDKARRYTQLPTGDYISGIALECLEYKRLILLIGRFGLCKTTIAKHLAQTYPMTHESPGIAYVSLADEERTASAVYQSISDVMRINERVSTRGRSVGQRVRNTLRKGDLLIIDEANYAFQRGTWATLRDIFDHTPASVLMIVNPDGEGLVKQEQEALGAFLQRARIRRIEQNDPKDGEFYAKSLGYSREEIIHEAGVIAAKPGINGGMRVLARVFEDAEKQATLQGVEVTLSLLRKVAAENCLFFK